MLDIGCGNGGFLLKIKEEFDDVKCMGLDGSIGMLSKNSKINVSHWVAAEDNQLPMSPGSVDLIIMNQFIHHLNPDVLQNLCLECKKALSPNGMIYINTSTKKQIYYSLWWSYYFKDESLNKFTDKLETSIKVFKNNLVMKESKILPDLFLKNYCEFDQVFMKEFRDGDSMWSLLSDEELKGILKKIKTGTVKVKFDQSESHREKKGLSISYVFHNYCPISAEPTE